jgi:hypothetical protein
MVTFPGAPLLGVCPGRAEVDSGSWHAPQVVVGSTAPADPAGPASQPGAALPASALSALRGLMRSAVSSGAAQAANTPGAPVYGQVGLVHSASGWTSWFVGYRGDVAFTVLESGSTAQLSAAALAGAFVKALSHVPSVGS